MDLAALRSDIKVIGQTCGLNAWDYQPDDPQNLPALVVGGMRSLTRLNQVVAQIEVSVHIYVNAADPKDATRALDALLSINQPAKTSFIDVLDSEMETLDTPSWRSIKFLSAGPYTHYIMPGGLTALGVEVILELTA